MLSLAPIQDAISAQRPEPAREDATLDRERPSFVEELIDRLQTLDGCLQALMQGYPPGFVNTAPGELPEGLGLPATPVDDAQRRLWQTGGVQGGMTGWGVAADGVTRSRPTGVSGAGLTGPGELSRLQQMVVQAAERYGVDPALALAVAKAESGFNAYAVSPKGAQGVMQLMPGTAAALGVTEPLDPEQNIDGGVRYLRQVLDRFGGRADLAVAAYNAGPNAVSRYGGVPPYAETQAYVRNVLSSQESFQNRPLSAAPFLHVGREHATGASLPVIGQPVPEAVPPTAEASVAGRPGPGDAGTSDLPAGAREGQSPAVRLTPGEIPVARPGERDGETPAAQLDAETGLSVPAPAATPGTGLGGTSTGQRPQTSLGEAASAQEPTRAMAPSGATVRELIAEIPDPDGGALTRVRIGLDASREHGPAVHVAVQVDDPGVVASLKAEASALRQQLWHHGLELAQFAASSESNRGRDAETSQPGDSRALPGVRASRPRESQDRTTILEGIWA